VHDNNQFGPDLSGQPKQSWFGPKRIGFGYGPRTWQGYLVTGVMAALLVIVGTVAGAHSPWFVVAIVAFLAIHLAIIAIQRR
jgi:4-hydroxybenzoate polyprenyltransferase